MKSFMNVCATIIRNGMAPGAMRCATNITRMTLRSTVFSCRAATQKRQETAVVNSMLQLVIPDTYLLYIHQC